MEIIGVLLFLAVLAAFSSAFSDLDEDGQRWVTSKYGAYRIRLTTQMWLLALIGLLFLFVYLGLKLMGGHGLPD